MLNHPVITSIVASVLLPALVCLAATQFASTEDAHIQNTLGTPPIAVLDQDSSQLFAGCAGTVGKDRCSVIPFQLPDFGAVDDPCASASFLFNYEGSQNGPVGNVDVYGLGRRAAPTVLVEDYWTATSTVDPSDATLIAQDVIARSQPQTTTMRTLMARATCWNSPQVRTRMQALWPPPRWR
jgi:hypothetical protein